MALSVGIIGSAPSGTMAFERLVAHLSASPLEEPVEIHIFNRNTLFGCGDIYDPEQLDCLLTNVSAGDFNMWSSDEPPGVVSGTLPLHEWCHQRCQPPVFIAAADHASRALAGRYLATGFEAIADNLPTGVSLHRHVGDVVDIEPKDGGYQVLYRKRNAIGSEKANPKKAYPEETVPEEAKTKIGVGCDQLLLATGHTRLQPTPEEIRYAEFADRHPGCRFVPSVYPVAESLAGVTGSVVALKGMSLTFVDAVLALTEGTGGRFEREESGRLTYHQSGGEPARILPFSRTGLPARPRASDISWYQHRPIFCTREAHEAILERSPGGKIDFERDLWPLYEQEMEWAYYRVLMKGTVFEHRLQSCGNDFAAVRKLIESFHRFPPESDQHLEAYLPEAHHPDACRFDARSLLDPVGSRSFSSGAAFHEFASSFLRSQNEKAAQGAAKNAAKAAVEMWRFCRVVMLPYLAAGGLTPDSHRRLHNKTWSRMQQMVFGPPIENMEKIHALTEARLLDFSVALAPEVVPGEETRAFRLRCERTASEAAVDILVDARVPSFVLSQQDSLLYQNLERRGLVRAFENAQSGVESSQTSLEPAFQPGGIDLTSDNRFVIGADGRINPNISVTGVPAQGCIYDNISPLQQERRHPAGVWAANVMTQWQRNET